MTNSDFNESNPAPSIDNTQKKPRFYQYVLIPLGTVFLIAAAAGGIYYYNNYSSLSLSCAAWQEKYNSSEEQLAALSSENETLKATLASIPDFVIDEWTDVSPEIPFAVDLSDWKYILVNETNPLSEDFEVEVVKTKNGQYVDKRIKEDLENMIEVAKEDDVTLLLCSSYRNYAKQDRLMDESIRDYTRKGYTYQEAFFETKRTIALTGASEHHTGLALDIVDPSYQSLDEAQAKTDASLWLAENAADYGFILRYPKDKVDLTGIDYESWHYRYVGKDAALFMKEHNLCLEEFIELAQKQDILSQKQEASQKQNYEE